MHFSSQYTQFRFVPLEGGNATNISLSLQAMLEIDWAGVGQAAYSRIIVSALNQYAGGRRTLNGHRVNIDWSLSWREPRLRRMSPTSGGALGICGVPADVIEAARSDAAAMFVSDSRGDSRISRIFLESEEIQTATQQRTRRQRRRARTARDRVAAHAGHELGHGYGLEHSGSRDSLMYRRMLTRAQRRRLNQHWTDDELIEVLGGLFTNREREQIAWL